MNVSKKKALLAASIAGLMTVAVTAAPQAQAAEGVPCYGINACKGTGDCGGKGTSCHGSNACKGQGWLQVPADLCTKIEGGKLKAE
jgi:uncharacterized membrane protein